jgi:hypothetical protein
MVFASTDNQKGCGNDTACHGPTVKESGLDLVSPGVASRLLGKAPDPRTSIACAGNSTPYLLPGTAPAGGLLFDKLSNTPPCGSPCPFPLGGLPTTQKNCLLQWATAVTLGASAQ